MDGDPNPAGSQLFKYLNVDGVVTMTITLSTTWLNELLTDPHRTWPYEHDISDQNSNDDPVGRIKLEMRRKRGEKQFAILLTFDPDSLDQLIDGPGPDWPIGT